jgi:hypothetical protein
MQRKSQRETGTFAAGMINNPSQSSGLRFPFEPCLSALGRVAMTSHPFAEW